MRWQPGHSSPDVIDRRGRGGGGGGLFWLLPFLIRTPFGWVVLLILGGVWLFGRFGGDGQRAREGERGGETARSGDTEKQFVSFVLDDVQSTWSTIFANGGESYERSKLVLYSGATETGCGFGRAATGPFYCPVDDRVYLDLSFFQELESQLGARGDFAQAYVIAHEIGHHVQDLLGTTAGKTEKGAEGSSVRVELQADCYAGVWAHATAQRDLLEKGDIEEALNAAAAIGDDRLQRESRGAVVPDSFTHGTSAQRVRWFRKGWESGSPNACDTFSATDL